MERLTTKIDSKYQLSDEFDYGGKYMVGCTLAGEEEYDEYPDYGVAVDKLGQLEDIMEKHNIESLEELENIIKNNSKLAIIEELENLLLLIDGIVNTVNSDFINAYINERIKELKGV